MAKYRVLIVLLALLVLGPGCRKRRERDTYFLFHAARSGDVDEVRNQLALGLDVDARDSSGDTALHEAASGGHADVAQLLLARGAEIDSLNHYGRTPLSRAVTMGHAAVVKLLWRPASHR